jgi:glycine hydroxymethyltransferase
MKTDENNFFKLLDLVHNHDMWMNETINLIASENRLSPLVSNVLKSDFGNRVAEGWLGERVFPGIKYYEEIEKYGMDLACRMFHAEFADVRPISGTIANMIVFNAFTKPGDTIASISIASGAHISMAGSTPKKVLGLRIIELPFNHQSLTIDLPEAIRVIKKEKPKIVVLGGSVLLFNQPVKELADICREIGVILLFDAAHVAGLIATGRFPNPFDDGADIMTITLCKTIPGPQHAFILSRKEFSEKIKRTTFPNFLSGHHLHETVASIITMEEMKTFGKEYVNQVLANAKALAQNLSDLSFNVLAESRGYTETHMLLVDISNIFPATEAEKLLENANIIANRNMLPGDSSFLNPSGLRIGTQEITRIGMKEENMEQIALFFKRVLIDRENTNSVKNDVLSFRENFKTIHYCYE